MHCCTEAFEVDQQNYKPSKFKIKISCTLLEKEEEVLMQFAGL
jgi:hypothetical protein